MRQDDEQWVRLDAPRRRLRIMASGLFISCLALGCADRLMPDPTDMDLIIAGEDIGTLSPNSIVGTSGKFSHVQSGMAYVTTVDATDYDDYQFLDLDSGRSTSKGWDLSFRRFLILSNGGVSGDGGVQILKFVDTEFDEVETTPGPDTRWMIDRRDGPSDEDSFTDTIFNNGDDDWYNYDLNDHSLSTKGYVYIVRSTEDRYYKLRIESYYDTVGTPGVMSFTWQEIEAPEEEIPEQDLPDDPDLVPSDKDDDTDEPTKNDEPDQAEDPGEPNEPEITAGLLTVDASSYEDFVYLSVENGVLKVDNPQASTAWDLAIRRYVFLTNSGTSGPGQGGALLDGRGLEFDELMSIGPDGFVPDEILPATDAPGSTEGTGNPTLEAWYDYHGLGVLTPKEQTFIIRTASGSYAKLRILSYSGGIFELALLPVSPHL